ncbi:CLUMA_CG020262, isoform A [Clunio marinus]|uniref:CLUMA_CG020262, isoform A n=1 Tax=Clunio marinus TaxID=568069 RepID=A0A1J1J4F7_9DIPT|nr:CLUMA_CG020262, isoform A [Clunio marinus]
MLNGHVVSRPISIRRDGKMAEKLEKQENQNFLVAYLKASSFHGVRHLTNFRRNHPFETGFWSLAILTFAVWSAVNASLLWTRYFTNPTVITIDREYLNRNITFPPMTLCLYEKLNESAMNEFLIEKSFNETRRADPKLRSFMNSLAHFRIDNLHELANAKENFFDIEDYISIIMRISNKFPHHITITSSNEIYYFEPILSEQLGLCYSFNSRISTLLSPNYLLTGNLENNSTDKLLEEVNYFDGDASAVTDGLSNSADIYYHGPNELPSKLKKITNEDPEQKSYISLVLIPVIIKSQKNTRDLFEFQRKCKFEDESDLEYFPQIYTQDLCQLECRMKKFLEFCDCLPFFYKRKGVSYALVDALQRNNDCQCLKDCNEIKYSVQASNTMFWFHDSRVSWMVTQTKVIYNRELIHGFTETLISSGANLSLFLGMSTLSVIFVKHLT